MKIRITQAGWENYSGPLSLTLFQDGVSVDEVTKREADFISTNVSIEEVDHEGNSRGPHSITQELLMSKYITVEVSEPMERGQDDTETAQEAETEENATEPQEPVETAPTVFYSREDLEKIADEKGIKGLREISNPLGVKSTIIHELMDLILEAQAAIVIKENTPEEKTGE